VEWKILGGEQLPNPFFLSPAKMPKKPVELASSVLDWSQELRVTSIPCNIYGIYTIKMKKNGDFCSLILIMHSMSRTEWQNYGPFDMNGNW
jgi:hypothetical protein